jgi:hypothetical protein
MAVGLTLFLVVGVLVAESWLSAALVVVIAVGGAPLVVMTRRR